jgi:hypothetical protein
MEHRSGMLHKTRCRYGAECWKTDCIRIHPPSRNDMKRSIQGIPMPPPPREKRFASASASDTKDAVPAVAMKLFYHWSNDIQKEFTISALSAESARQYIRHVMDAPDAIVKLTEIVPIQATPLLIQAEGKKSAERIAEILRQRKVEEDNRLARARQVEEDERKRVEELERKLKAVYDAQLVYETKTHDEKIVKRITDNKTCYAQVVKVNKLTDLGKRLQQANAIGQTFVVNKDSNIMSGGKAIVLSIGADIRHLAEKCSYPHVVSRIAKSFSPSERIQSTTILGVTSEGLLVNMSWLWVACGEADPRLIAPVLLSTCRAVMPPELVKMMLDYVIHVETDVDVSVMMRICNIGSLRFKNYSTWKAHIPLFWIMEIANGRYNAQETTSKWPVSLPINYTPPSDAVHDAEEAQPREYDSGSNDSGSDDGSDDDDGYAPHI